MNNRQDLLNELLDLYCRDTNQQIKVGEPVALHDWGINTQNNVIGYGRFVWDGQYRGFRLDVDDDLNTYLGIEKFYGVEDEYDLYRTSPRKINAEEIEQLKVLYYDLNKLSCQQEQ